MSSLKELRNSRIEKLERLKELGVDCYPAKSHRDTEIGEVLADFEHHEGKDVVVAGRILSLRSH
ncbi:lysine--tRNA ligase, partial [Patescibacteria group bacterium]|nr:lysine--tRNA ligase [Patescibacteria group bacterium]MBU1970546.1 lysine--tRNA ligase [Patescibacteria group bacterium]